MRAAGGITLPRWLDGIQQIFVLLAVRHDVAQVLSDEVLHKVDGIECWNGCGLPASDSSHTRLRAFDPQLGPASCLARRRVRKAAFFYTHIFPKAHVLRKTALFFIIIRKCYSL